MFMALILVIMIMFMMCTYLQTHQINVLSVFCIISIILNKVGFLGGLNIYIYLAALGLSCSMQDLSCRMWDLVP